METATDRQARASGDIRLGDRRIIIAIWLIVAFVLGSGIAREIGAAASGIPSGSYGHHIVWLDGEANLPTAASAFLLAFAALLLLAQSLALPAALRVDRFRWQLLSAGFFYLAVDEVAQLHEQIKAPLRAMASFTDWLAFPWVIVAIPAVLAVGIYYLPFLARLPVPTRLGFLAAGLSYVGGAVGMEMVNGRISTYAGYGSSYYAVGTVVEECLEMIGIAAFLTVLLRFMRHLRLRVLATDQPMTARPSAPRGAAEDS